MANTQTVLSKEPEARRRPSQLQSTEWTLEECDVYSRVLRDFLNLDCSSLSSDDALDDDEEAEEENDDDAGATDEAAFFEDEDEAGGMMRSVSTSSVDSISEPPRSEEKSEKVRLFNVLQVLFFRGRKLTQTIIPHNN